ncbi:hypothetical protein GGX14DRAFT_387217 [Mycena pura]|uniref:F-box domain-containing protein n=1 Tax=Mycena pura TaxID=153505 RepID=A0AAD7E2C6_9AGAR|nr:hypothetical protein GGX14DRAFT_387217 [Mycena pura]
MCLQHSDGPAPSPSAPIRRLATEILIEVFSHYSEASPVDSVRHVFQTELKRLANAPLLTLSQVHLFPDRAAFINVITVPLWNEGGIWLSPWWFHMNHDWPLPRRIFHLLAQHSHRWHTAAFTCPLDGINLAVLKGRLPLLKKLEINIPKSLSFHTRDFLDGTPLLDTLVVSSPFLDNVDSIIFNQILEFGCVVAQLRHIARVVSVLSKLKTGASHFNLSFHSDAEYNQQIALGIAPTVSNIIHFFCKMTGTFHLHHSHQVLGDIFASLTLPKLQSLYLKASQFPWDVLGWPQALFLSLSERSGFHRSLKALKIPHVRITDDELICVLSSLAMLEHLEIADKARVYDEGVDLLLITDRLLRSLTRTRTTACIGLVPRLRRLTCASRLKFTHSIFLDFVISRVEPFAAVPMRVEIRPLSEEDGSLDPAVHAHLRELASRDRQLVYTFGGVQYCHIGTCRLQRCRFQYCRYQNREVNRRWG